MFKPRGTNNLLMKGRIVPTLQPIQSPRLAKLVQFLTEMGKLLQRVQDQVRGLQQRSLPRVPREVKKREEWKGWKGSKRPWDQTPKK